MSYNKILFEDSDSTRKIVMNMPAKRNSLDEEMIYELTDIFKKTSAEATVKSVILTGAGGNFCSGLNLDYLHQISGFDILQNRLDSQKFKELLLSIYECRKPVIAMVKGYALAGGCGLASACDFIVASDNSQFGYTEVKIGFIPAIVMVFLLKRVTETVAKDLLLTSRFITGAEAVSLGFANICAPEDKLEETALKLSADLNRIPSSSIYLTKEMFANVSSMSFESALEYAVNMNAITRMTEECRNGVRNFLSKSGKEKK